MASFSKSERLYSRTLIQDIFSGNNRRVGKFPLLLLYQIKENSSSSSPTQTLFSVSKRKFPRAVDRNLLKRRMRESFRCFKNEFQELVPENKCLVMAVIYTGSEIVPSQHIKTTFASLYETLAQRISETD